MRLEVPLPDTVYVLAGDDATPRAALPVGAGRWTTPEAEVTLRPEPDGALRVGLAAPGLAGLSRVVLRWVSHPGGVRPALVLGDAWERGYGDLQWRAIQPERPLPWYWLGIEAEGRHSAGLGVRTRAGALCCWTVDEDGTALWLDVRAGNQPVRLGDRELAAATIVGVTTGPGTAPSAGLGVAARSEATGSGVAGFGPAGSGAAGSGAAGLGLAGAVGSGGAGMAGLGLAGLGLAGAAGLVGSGGAGTAGGLGATPFAALEELCAAMSPDPLLPAGPVVGCNNWYYAYGVGFGPEAVLRDARTIAEYAGDHPVRPYCVVDDGWTEGGGTGPGGPWDCGLPGVFDDMAGLAAGIGAAGARPGLWFRPLRDRRTGLPLDPSRADTLATVAADVRRFRDWGYTLIKHDYSTFDVFGRFHSGTPAEMPSPGCPLADRDRTSAEVLVALYQTIADAAGDAVVIGCNTVGHLAAGLVQVQRVGDDTSGRDWECTRRMGVNSLAFRLAQHRRLYIVDADCVPCTPATEWALNRRFLDLVARSGTALFVSVDPAARTPRADADLTAAVRCALDGGVPGGVEPLDWLGTTAPRRWRAGEEELTYSWSQPWGARPDLPL